MQLKVLRGLSGFSSRFSLFAAFSVAGVAAIAAGCASELAEPDTFPVGGGGGAPPTATGGTTAAGGTIATGGSVVGTGGSVTPTAGTPGAGGTVGGSGGGTAPPLPACVKTALTNQTCTTCHAPATKDFFGGLDLMGDDVGQRLMGATAKNMMATNAAACGTKLIDPDNPAQSVFLKRITGTSDCGPPMPASPGVTGPDLECFRSWVMSF